MTKEFMDDKQNIIIYRSTDGRTSVALYAKDGNLYSQTTERILYK